MVDVRHPLSLNTRRRLRAVGQTDLLIGIGTRLDVPIARWAPAPAGLKTARIDIDPAEHRRLKVDVAIVADAADAHAGTARPRWRRKDDPARAEAIARGEGRTTAPRSRRSSRSMSYMEVIREVLPEDGIVVDEVTQVGYIIWYGYPVHQPRTLITSGFSGTLGYGFPTALGVKVGNAGPPGGGGHRRRRLPVRRLRNWRRRSSSASTW